MVIYPIYQNRKVGCGVAVGSSAIAQRALLEAHNRTSFPATLPRATAELAKSCASDPDLMIFPAPTVSTNLHKESTWQDFVIDDDGVALVDLTTGTVKVVCATAKATRKALRFVA